MVMIGIDPHKRSHTAVAIDDREVVLAERLVSARASQVRELLGWADALDRATRTWAIESAGGLGYLLAQQLVAAGEHVVDVPPMLAARVRTLGSAVRYSTAALQNGQSAAGDVMTLPRGRGLLWFRA